MENNSKIISSLVVNRDITKSQHSIYTIISELDFIVKNQLFQILLPLPQSISTLASTVDNDTFNPTIGNISKYIMDITNIYKDISFIVEFGLLSQSSFESQCIDKLIDINDVNIVRFLKVILPTLIEVILKRKTLREHETLVSDMLNIVSKLLAKPASHDIFELCELRHMILFGYYSNNWKFIDSHSLVLMLKSLAHTNSEYSNYTIQNIWGKLSSNGFYGDFGRPNFTYISNKTIAFWPDEWLKVLGGFKALGHFIQWYQDEPSSSVQSQSIGWYQGQVVGYIRDTDEYIIQVDTSGSSDNKANDYIPMHCNVKINKTKHVWIDINHKQRIYNEMLIENSSLSTIIGDPHLRYSDFLDKGYFIRIWWTRYNRYFYGRVLKYDSGLRTHLICYEDGDQRSYEMTTKDYELIVIPSDSDIDLLLRSKSSNLTDIQAAKIVADWHRMKINNSNSSTVTSNHRIEVQKIVKNTAASAQEQVPSVVIQRPQASSVANTNISTYQIIAINEYISTGGIDSLFQSLLQSDSNSSPSCKTILNHLQFLLQLKPWILGTYNNSNNNTNSLSKEIQTTNDIRSIGMRYYYDLIWDIKETIPNALLRFEDYQMKDMDTKDFNEILLILQDIIVASEINLLIEIDYSNISNNDNSNNIDKKKMKRISESFDHIRLKMVSKLLICSQIQKRYTGISMVKDIVDKIMPKLDSYMIYRHRILKIPRNTKQQCGRITQTNYKFNLTSIAIDNWLVQEGLIELLFGESLHSDLIAKSDSILVYMATRKLLTEQHLDIIWQATLGIHEAVVRVLHQLILIIIPVLDPILRMYLFSMISALPSWEFTEQILQLIASYTVQSLIAFREESAAAAIQNPNSKSSNIMDVSASNNPISSQMSFTVPTGSSNLINRKGLVMSSSQRQWMGFGVLWQFVQDPNISVTSISGKGGSSTTTAAVTTTSASQNRNTKEYQQHHTKDIIKQGVNESLIDLAIQLLVDLLQEEFKDEREFVMQRCLENMKYGISVPVSLQILRRTLALYPLSNKSWFLLGRQNNNKTLTVGYQIEKLIKHSQLLDILFRDLDSFHRNMLSIETIVISNNDNQINNVNNNSIKKSSSNIELSSSQHNDNRVQPNGKLSRVSHLKAVVERLDFLKFIISSSSVKLNESQTMILWSAFGEGATTIETLEKLVGWLHSLINKESKLLTFLLNRICSDCDTDIISSSSLINQSSNIIQSNQYITQPSKLAMLFSKYNDSSLAAKSVDVDSSLTEDISKTNSVIVDPIPTFDDGVLVKLFEEHILKWTNESERISSISRQSVATLCFKLFFLTNISSKSIRVETIADGSWHRCGPLSGVAVLWRLAMDATDEQVSIAAITLLVELHHRTLPSSITVTSHKPIKPVIDAMKKHILQLCFKYLYFSIQSIQEGDVINDSKSNESGNDSYTDVITDEWFNDKDKLLIPYAISMRIWRLVLCLRQFIHRFYISPRNLCTVKVLVGREESLAFALILKETDKIGYLRYKISEYFKESIEAISISKGRSNKSTPSSTAMMLNLLNNSSDILDKDDLTLFQAGLIGIDSCDVVVRRKEQYAGNEVQNSPLNSIDSSHSPPQTVKDLISAEELSENLLSPLQPLQWLYINTSSSLLLNPNKTSTSNTSSIVAITDHDLDYIPELFKMSPLPLYSTIQLQLRRNAVDEAQKENLGRISFVGGIYPCHIIEQWNIADLKYLECLEQIVPYFTNAPAFIDHLIEMLDGYLSTTHFHLETQINILMTDISSVVWDLLLSLPMQPQICQQIESANWNTTSLSQLLSPNCPYRMLYTLQIIEKTLLKEGGLDWSINFFHQGGAEYIVQLLNKILLKQSNHENDLNKQNKLKSNDSCIGMPRCDVIAMNIAMISRVLHHILTLDPSYSAWQSISTRAHSHKRTINEYSFANLPAGVILSCIELESFLKLILVGTINMCELFSHANLTASTLQIVSDNLFLLLYNVIVAFEDSTTIFQIEQMQSLFIQWIFKFCVECKAKHVRDTSCRRLFEAFANIFYKCANPRLKQENKRNRLQIFDIFFDLMIEVVKQDNEAISNQGGELYTLLAAVEALRTSPYLIFPQISSKNNVSSKNNSSKISSDGSSSPLLSPMNNNENETLVNIIDPFYAFINRLFIEKLIKFSSNTRSNYHHSQSHDNNVINGILRMLLILANNEKDRDYIGNITLSLTTMIDNKSQQQQSYKLISYLYQHCLFPLYNGEAMCQSKNSRSFAFALLYRLCECTISNLHQLVDVMLHLPSKTYSSIATNTDLVSCMKTSNELVKTQYSKWNYDPTSLIKESNAYVGLCNQGGTCYMNSLLQQLFHIKTFTNGFLSITSQHYEHINDMKDNELLLYQLQIMFGFMRLSQKQYYDTLPFCEVFKDYDGSPISLCEQKDINEFAGMLFEKLEQNLIVKNLLTKTIQGQIVWKTKSLENSYRSERDENFYMITAEVKDKVSLEDSLELYTAAELFSGDNKIEDSEGRKVDALRNCAIKVLPPTLIIHLKRFEFDLETLDRKKVNDYISFPMDLNMFNYTEEGILQKEENLKIPNISLGSDGIINSFEEDHSNGTTSSSLENTPTTTLAVASSNINKIEKKPDAYYQYTLKGIVAHVGAIDRGHYYSFIKEEHTKNWFEFNDRKVAPFSIEAIPSECFGGKEEGIIDRNGMQSNRIRENNAYLLVYERKEPSVGVIGTGSDVVGMETTCYDVSGPVKHPISSSTSVVDYHTTTDVASNYNSHSSNNIITPSSSSVAICTSSTKIAKHILDAVSLENQELQRDQFLFNSKYFAFLWQISSMLSVTNLLDIDNNNTRTIYTSDIDSSNNATNSTLSKLLLVELQFVIEVLSHARANECIPFYLDRMQDIIKQDHTKQCAVAIINELGCLEYYELTLQLPTQSNSTTTTTTTTANLELCHPWLHQILLKCPSIDTIKGFLKLIYNCLMSIRNLQVDEYLHLINQRDTYSTNRTTSIKPITMESTSITSSSITTLVYKHSIPRLIASLIHILTVANLDNHKETYSWISLFLKQFALIGKEEQVLLISMNCISRLIESVLKRVSPQHLPEMLLKFSIDLIAILVKHMHSKDYNDYSSSEIIERKVEIIPTNINNVKTKNKWETSENKLDNKPDIKCKEFFNRSYLEVAIFISPNECSSAIIQIYSKRDNINCSDILEFMMEYIMQATNPVSNSGTKLHFKCYFKVLSDVLLGPAISNITNYHPIIQKLVNKARLLSTRSAPNDVVLVNTICKLLHNIGLINNDGHDMIMKLKDFWKDIHMNLANSKRIPIMNNNNNNNNNSLISSFTFN